VGREEKWPKQCMHIWKNELKKVREGNIYNNIDMCPNYLHY
jgi:hypothetical protein